MHMMFTKLERNKIYNVIARSYLDPAECSFSVTGQATKIVHSSGSEIRFSYIKDNRRVWRLTAYVEDGTKHQFNVSPEIDNVLIYIERWAQEVRLVLDTPDYWAEAQKRRELIDSIRLEESSNTFFNQDEQRQIVAQLQQVQTQMGSQFELTTEQVEQIRVSLDHAAEASKRMGRKDWLQLFGGSIFTLIITDMVSPAIGGHIFATVVQTLIHLFTGASGPPEILP
jgi:hypothetical protein